MTHETTPLTYAVLKPATSGELQQQTLEAIGQKTIPHAVIRPQDRDSAPEIAFFRVSETSSEVISGNLLDERELVLHSVVKLTGERIEFTLNEDPSKPATALIQE